MVKKLATGGMAEVWLARQTGIEGFNRHIVVKRILSHLAEDPEFVSMFLQEARIASRFNHPNIAQIYDLGEHEGTFFIAMEFVHGEDLGRIMRRAWATGQWVARPLAARIVADAAAGLHYAHSRLDAQGRPMRIVHRDVSPQNILVSFDGSVKLVDFGIAKAADQASNTKSGAIKGKFAYMAPEQAGGKALDARTDLFALGLVLYELVTGVRPLKRESEIGTLQAALECAIEKPSLVADVPPSLDDVIMRAVAKDPEDRYRDARQFQMALEQHLVQEGTVATSVQVSELMETLFADRLREEARLGAPAPSTESSVSNPVAEPGAASFEGKVSSTDLASVAGRAVRPPKPQAGPGLTRDEGEAYDEPPADDAGPSIAGFQLPAGTVMPTRAYAPVTRKPPKEAPEPARPPAQRSAPPPDTTAQELDAVPEGAEAGRAPPRKRTTSQAMPEAPPRKSRVGVPAPKATPPRRRTGEKSEVSKLVDVRSMKERQASRLKALAVFVALASLVTLAALFREPLVAFFTRRPIDHGTPLLLTITTKPRVRVQVVPPPDALGRQRLDLGETPLERVSGAFVNDTILLLNEERCIRAEERFDFGEPFETKFVSREFTEGTLTVTTSPTLKGATIFCGKQPVGQVGLNLKLMEGTHENLELRSDRLERPFPFPKPVVMKPRGVEKVQLDLSAVLEASPGGR
ncbi:MAG: protein kinase [Myxococcaceae bacterium]|nr:protein kinase [Myxococcaceae bacterium]